MLTVTVDQRILQSSLAAAPGQLRYATVQAINKTAWDTRDALKAEMPRVFTQYGPPTPYTVNSLRTYPAKSGDMTAEVNFKGKASSHYLLPEVFGGARPLKQFEKALGGGFYIPNFKKVNAEGGAPMDRYGNVTGAQIMRMLSVLGKARTGQNQTAGKRKIRVLKGIKQFYTTKAGHIAESGSGNSPAKIWFYRRTKAPIYQAIFKFDDVAKRTVEAKLMPNIQQSVSLALRRAGL